MNTDIITKDDYVPSNRERIRAYRNRLDDWLEHAPAEAELVKQTSKYPLVTIPEGRTEMTNISKFLRKGGAK